MDPPTSGTAPGEVLLRDVTDDDLPILFDYQRDPDAVVMAAFTPRDPTDRDAFMAHWARIRADDSVDKQTILFDGQVAGSIVSFIWGDHREIGYWVGKPFWGKGIATRAVAAFVRRVPTRPLYAHVAGHNLASRRVLEKCGFVVTGTERGFSNALGKEIDELVLTLADPPPSTLP